MSGKTEYLIYGIVFISLVAAGTDIARGKIYNWLTLPGMIGGLAAMAVVSGWAGALDSLGGIGLGFLLYGVLFFMGAMGAGDVKMLMALGAWGGWQFALHTGVLGIFIGGAVALVLLIATGRIGGFLRRIHHFFLSLTVKELAVEPPRLDRGFTMPFGVSIGAAAIWVAVGNPIKRWEVFS